MCCRADMWRVHARSTVGHCPLRLAWLQEPAWVSSGRCCLPAALSWLCRRAPAALHASVRRCVQQQQQQQQRAAL
jgi:hypothetical protein